MQFLLPSPFSKGMSMDFMMGMSKRRMLRVCVLNGIVDGALDIPSLSVDTIPEEADVGVVEMMRVIVQKSL